MEKANLGKYLHSERIHKHYENISKYLGDYRINISESYYRDLESGRKLLRIETAKDLCEDLN